jgi:PTS system nitrogen regulatory IIA component
LAGWAVRNSFGEHKVKFADFVCFEAIIPELKARDRDGVIAELVSALDKAGRLGRGNCEEIIKEMIKREKQASTGMGKCVAVPHVKHPAVKDVVATVGQSSTGIDFSALDKQPVYSVILLVSPVDNPDTHLQAMENVFRHLQQEKFRKFLRQSRKPEQIEELFREADESPF